MWKRGKALGSPSPLLPLGGRRGPSLETNGKKTPASSSILKYDGVNSRRPSLARSILRQGCEGESRSSPVSTLQPPRPILPLCCFFPRRPTKLAPTIIRLVAPGYTPLSRNCKGNRRWNRSQDRGDRFEQGEGSSMVKKKEGRKGGSSARWMAPRSRRGNAKRRDESLKEGKKTG